MRGGKQTLVCSRTVHSSNVDSNFEETEKNRMNIIRISETNRKWYEIILWWEIRRIPYNIIMYLIGMLSFYICFVTIPLIYIIIGIALNIIYTLGWIIELIGFRKWNNEKKAKYSKYLFYGYIVFSAIAILGFATFLLWR